MIARINTNVKSITNTSVYTENIFSYTLNALEAGYKFDSYKYHVENTYIETFKDGYNPFSDYLKRICEFDIDSPLLMTFNMVNSVSDGTYVSQNALKEYLNINKYKNCPKLMILNNVYLFRAGMPFSCEEIYELYKNHPEYFEEEDRVNLVWLLYESGEYIKTYTISKAVMNPDDESTDNIDGTSEEASEEAMSTKDPQTSEEDEKEDQIDITAEEFKYTMLLIRAESYLQDSESLSEVDQNTLYRDITNALEDFGFANTELDNAEFNSDNEKGNILIEDPIVARLKLAQCILAGRIGIDISYKGLSNICEQLFNTDSETGLYIVASLLYQDGNYEQSVDICEKILSTAKTKNDFQSRVLLLEADAWISLAEKADVEQVRMDCYGNAETILSAVRKMAQNDYIASSQRLVKLYEAMGREDEAYEVEKEMAELLSNQYKLD